MLKTWIESVLEFIHQWRDHCRLPGRRLTVFASSALLSSSSNISCSLPAAADISERFLPDVNLLVPNLKSPRGSRCRPGSDSARSHLKRKTQLTSYCLHTLLSIMYNIHCIDTKWKKKSKNKPWHWGGLPGHTIFRAYCLMTFQTHRICANTVNTGQRRSWWVRKLTLKSNDSSSDNTSRSPRTPLLYGLVFDHTPSNLIACAKKMERKPTGLQTPPEQNRTKRKKEKKKTVLSPDNTQTLTGEFDSSLPRIKTWIQRKQPRTCQKCQKTRLGTGWELTSFAQQVLLDACFNHWRDTRMDMAPPACLLTRGMTAWKCSQPRPDHHFKVNYVHLHIFQQWFLNSLF